MLIDFHSHILPGIDDGSKDIQESLAMLRLSAAGGVTHIIATPHFYASSDSPERFLRRRLEAWRKLKPMLEPGMPQILLGAEVYYFEGLCYSNELPLLRVEGTDVLLLEMPFSTWTERMVRDVIDLGRRGDTTVVLAHIDRYLHYQTKETWETLLSNCILTQINASAVLEGRMASRKILQLVQNGRAQVIGSDCHNMDSRKPNLAVAMEKIAQTLGQEAAERLIRNAKGILKLRT